MTITRVEIIAGARTDIDAVPTTRAVARVTLDCIYVFHYAVIQRANGVVSVAAVTFPWNGRWHKSSVVPVELYRQIQAAVIQEWKREQVVERAEESA